MGSNTGALFTIMDVAKDTALAMASERLERVVIHKLTQARHETVGALKKNNPHSGIGSTESMLRH